MVNKEGFLFISFFIVLALVLQKYAGIGIASIAWVLTAFIVFLFRDPQREIPSSPLAVLSPVDGRVLSVENAHDPYVDRSAIKIAIAMNALGTYTTRSPTEGKIMQRWFGTPGAESNSKDFGIWIQTDEQDDIVLVLQSLSFINSPKCYIHSGERIGQGKKCGFIRFGSNLVVYLPENSKINVSPGDRLTAGTTPLAQLIHDENTINENLLSA